MERGYGCNLFGDEQDAFFAALSDDQRRAIRNARYGRNGWIIESCVKSLRALEVIRQEGRGITARGRQMMTRIIRDAAA